MPQGRAGSSPAAGTMIHPRRADPLGASVWIKRDRAACGPARTCGAGPSPNDSATVSHRPAGLGEPADGAVSAGARPPRKPVRTSSRRMLQPSQGDGRACARFVAENLAVVLDHGGVGGVRSGRGLSRPRVSASTTRRWRTSAGPPRAWPRTGPRHARRRRSPGGRAGSGRRRVARGEDRVVRAPIELGFRSVAAVAQLLVRRPARAQPVGVEGRPRPDGLGAAISRPCGAGGPVNGPRRRSACRRPPSSAPPCRRRSEGIAAGRRPGS